MRTVPKMGRINLDMLRNKTSATIGSIANSTTRQITSLRKLLHSRVDYNQFNYCVMLTSKTNIAMSRL
jgi:hypothetical protein